jgi:hypothetical protein
VRNREPGLVDHLILVQEEIQIDATRPATRPRAFAPEPPLDGEEASQELLWRERRLDRTRRVQEAGLVEVTDGVRLPKSRHGDDVNTRLGVEQPQPLSEIVLPIAQVRP